MKIAKEFRWEMGHRLPEHFDKCKNIHGHSYKMIIELEGEVVESGMVMDYYEIKKIINPIIEKLDHAFMVYNEDKEIISFLKKMKSKMVVVEFQSTVENICKYFLNEIKKISLPKNIKKVSVRIYETVDDYAEEFINLSLP
ncbi:MAG: 6-carboxytetrahydropterin synthase QueD [Ignavibacteria bacterium]|nr:6-carboxytetrahydropterin synthase QueD [Ignavibacteria bacterium]